MLKSIIAQTNYQTYQLPTPQNLTPIFVGPITGSGIYYGAQPSNPNPNLPVLVYVHGFIDLNNLWFLPGNDFYEESYNANYRCAFVATTRGQGMWDNGEILADMLNDITRHYGVNKVVLVAHSNGGKASEVAMISHHQRNKVDRVISLGTPFFGTELANLAETPAFSWLVNFIGLGGGTSTSTTYYMGGFARPLLDWSWFNQPNKFINFGGWGYNNGTTLLSPTMAIGGNLLNWMGSGASSGGNDGVTPYWSSTRPGGHPQWAGQGTPVSQVDHVDIAYSPVMWNHIQPLFDAPLSSLRTHARAATPSNTTITSNLQFLSSEDDNQTFIVEKNTKRTAVICLHQNKDFKFELFKQNANGSWSTQPIAENTLVQTESYLEGFASAVNLPSLEAGTYKVASQDKFAAIINHKNGVVLEYDNAHAYVYNNKDDLSVNLTNTEAYDLSQATVKAIITQTAALDGKALAKPIYFIEEFKWSERTAFTLNIKQQLPNGVYNMVIQAQHPEFQKSLATGFVVNQDNNQHEEVTFRMHTTDLKTFPNPTVDVIQVAFETTQKDAALNLYDINGRLLLQKTIHDLGIQQHTIDLNALNLVQGTYFIEIQDGDQKQTTTFQKIE